MPHVFLSVQRVQQACQPAARRSRSAGTQNFPMPAIGTAHGFYKATPVILYDRMQYLVEATHMPMVVHGGTGLTDEVFQRLISLGAAKLNISTALKKTYADGFRTYLEAHPTEYDPLKLIGAVRSDIVKMVQPLFKTFGSEGRV